MNDNISVILSDNLKNRIPLLMNILEEYGIREQKRVYLQASLLHSSYYVHCLISLISKIDFELVKNYMPLVGAKEKISTEEINHNERILAVEKIRNSPIVISNHKISNEDWLDDIFDKTTTEPYDVIIIDDFDKLLKESKKEIKTIEKTIEEYSKKHNTYVILFAKDNRLKSKFFNWKFAEVNSPLKFIFDDKNYNIVDICEGVDEKCQKKCQKE